MAADAAQRPTPGPLHSEYEELLARARARVEHRSGLHRESTLLCFIGWGPSSAVIRYAVALALEPEVARSLVDRAREAYAADPVLWGQFLAERVERDGSESPLRQAVSLLAAPAA